MSNNNISALLDTVLERSIPHIANLSFIKETIHQMKVQVDSYEAAEKFLDKMILKERDPTKNTDLKILQMYLSQK
ncbi:MAG: hypothetical protein ACE5R6_11975 [Candidatus Heimdallarchaeota archaeon]